VKPGVTEHLPDAGASNAAPLKPLALGATISASKVVQQRDAASAHVDLATMVVLHSLFTLKKELVNLLAGA
jgi:hypothetical protein